MVKFITFKNDAKVGYSRRAELQSVIPDKT